MNLDGVHVAEYVYSMFEIKCKLIDNKCYVISIEISLLNKCSNQSG